MDSSGLVILGLEGDTCAFLGYMLQVVELVKTLDSGVEDYHLVWS